MKNFKKYIVLLLCMLLIAGCGNQKGTAGKGISNTNSVDKVINDQIANEDGKAATTESEEASSDVESSKDMEAEDVEGTRKEAEDTGKTEGSVDYDLTEMGSDMIYATVYQMMVTPEEYEGKTFRMEGNFNAGYYEGTQKYYFYCIIQDATACCAQGMEFVWGDGSHIYPDEYPEENAEIIVEGTFETYSEEGDPNQYCRLSDATLQQVN